jgi:hypothetical protein
MTFVLDRQPLSTGRRFKNLTGRTFGRLKVLHFCGNQSASGGRATAVWACKCECGTIAGVYASALNSGNTTSCGCRKHEHPGGEPDHGMSYAPEYKAWKSLKRRCLNPSSQAYRLYGARGISVHPAWITSFEAFFDHVGPRPSPKHSIDRIDNDGNYEPGNVRWATAKQQASNRRYPPRHHAAQTPGAAA